MKDTSYPGVAIRDVGGRPVLTMQDGLGGIQFPLEVKTASFTLTKADSGSIFLCDAANLVVTLPATESGVAFRFILGVNGLSVGTGLSLSPAAVDAIHGNGLTSVDNKDLILSGASDRVGDAVEIVGDGVAGWFIQSIIGTWSKEA